MTGKIVIYARYSTDMQSTKSCEDQELEVRDRLAKLGIDHRYAKVIFDQAWSGTGSSRPGFVRLVEMIGRGEISILATDDLSRLTRGGDAMTFIRGIVYSGARFLSFGEAIDKDQDGRDSLATACSKAMI